MTLNFDHDGVDGARPARFIQRLSGLIPSGHGLGGQDARDRRCVK